MRATFLAVTLALTHAAAAEKDTLPPLKDGRVPRSVDEIWKDFDPRREPLETEVLKEWEDDGLVCRIVRFRVGVFKGVKSWVGGLYAFPKGASKLPGLIQVHGGGQSANLNAATTNARRGYACLSLNWGGNPLNDGNYQKIWKDAATDWGAVDATHPPKRDPINHFASTEPNAFTIDAVESPRNSAWFLVTIAVRRGLTFLENQPEVDGTKLGVYGHSMGGKLTVMTAGVDPRVKAAVPTCGGITDHTASEKGLESSNYLKRLTCPVMFLNPVNDFHGRIDDLPNAIAMMPSKTYGMACAANLDHRDRPEHFACGPLWFDQHLKGAFTMPATPHGTLNFDMADRVPRFPVRPDQAMAVKSVEVYYTQLARDEKTSNPCWRHVRASIGKEGWEAALPLMSNDRPLRVYANVYYPLEKPLIGAGYYYGLYSTSEFAVSTKLVTISPGALQRANAPITDRAALAIESFEPGWQRGWYVFGENGDWPFRTNKIQDPKWKGPAGAKLSFEVRSAKANKLVVQIDQHAVEVELAGGDSFQLVALASAVLCDAEGKGLVDWSTAQELMLGDKTTLKKGEVSKRLGADWRGERPTFRKLRWETSGK